LKLSMSHAGSLSSSGSEFQTVGPATGKARRPYVQPDRPVGRYTRLTPRLLIPEGWKAELASITRSFL